MKLLNGAPVAQALRLTMSDHPAIALVAWCGVVVSVALSVALSLIGTSVRASLVADLELGSRDAMVIESRGAGTTPCTLEQFRCDARDATLTERAVTATRDAFGDHDVGELYESQITLSTRGYEPRTVRLLAVDEPWLAMQPIRWRTGRGFATAEMRGDRRVTLIGHSLVDSITAETGQSPRELRLDGIPHTIIGVIESGVTAITSMDNAIIVPRQSHDLPAGIRSGRRRLLVHVNYGAAGDEARATLVGVLRQAGHLRPLDSLTLEIRGFDDHMGLIDKVWKQLDSALWRLALLLALTASVGVGALQYTVAAARRHELGVRRAVGARKYELVWLGVFDSLSFMCVSSSIGAVLAVLTCASVAIYLDAHIVGVGAALLLGVGPVLVCGAAAGGIAFGHFARMQPSELLGRSL